MRSLPRRTVVWLGSLSLLAIFAAVVFGRQIFLEHWYVYQLSSNEAATVEYAATQLARNRVNASYRLAD